MSASSNPILLYDGVCGLCNWFVQFILRRDKADRFRFAALQSEFAREILERHQVNALELDTVYLVQHHREPGECLSNRSEAAMAVGRELGGWWRALAMLFRLWPKRFRDWLYDRIASSRYRLFGKYDACPLPDPKVRHRFLDQSGA